jgi:hypothetical protein
MSDARTRVERAWARADSVLASLSRRDFDAGMKALRATRRTATVKPPSRRLTLSFLGARECRRHSKRWLVEALP